MKNRITNIQVHVLAFHWLLGIEYWLLDIQLLFLK